MYIFVTQAHSSVEDVYDIPVRNCSKQFMGEVSRHFTWTTYYIKAY